MKPDAAIADFNLELAEEVAKYYADPLGFVLFAFPWDENGELEGEPGPDETQSKFLEAVGAEVRKRAFNGTDAVMPILANMSSGHGTGKSAMGAWLGWWILSTRPFSQGTVTAGTYDQLKARTWAAFRRWGALCITSHWFDIQASGIFHKQYPADWKVEIQSCKEENAQAFAGQHAKRSTSWYLMDEASIVPDSVYTVAYGGLTDGEPMMFAWGQPVKNTGEFYNICFGGKKARWDVSMRVDSRTSRHTNKELIAQWIEDYGIDSDFVKVRVLGLPPSASELQYIDKTRVELARKRIQVSLPSEPIIAGFDVSGGGKAWNVIRFRCGLNGNPAGLNPIRIPGEQDPDRSRRVGVCAELLRDMRPGYRISALFIDSAFGAPIAERLKSLGYGDRVYEVNFGSQSPDALCKNMRAYMHKKCKDWLLTGGLRNDELLCSQLCLAGYHIDHSGKLVIESKESIQERGESSPDDADAFMLTFAQPVALEIRRPGQHRSAELSPWS